MGGTQWTCFYTKPIADSTSHADSTKTSIFVDSFGGKLDKFLLQQSPKPITFNIFKTQDTNTKVCGVHCF